MEHSLHSKRALQKENLQYAWDELGIDNDTEGR